MFPTLSPIKIKNLFRYSPRPENEVDVAVPALHGVDRGLDQSPRRVAVVVAVLAHRSNRRPDRVLFLPTSCGRTNNADR